MLLARIAFLCWFFPMAALAAENAGTPRIRHSVLGIHSQFRNRFWTPFTVELENPGNEWRGAIVVEVRSEFSQQLVSLTRPVWMPAHSFRRFDFPLLPDFFVAPMSGGAAMQTALTLKLTDGGAHVLDQTEVLAQPVAEDAFHVVSADARLPGYRFLNNLVVGPEKRPLFRAAAQPQELPHRAIEYDGFDAIILGDLTNVEFSPAQIESISDWVKGGGLLFVTPGPWMTNAVVGATLHPLADLLPVSFFSTTRIATLPALRRWGPAVEFSSGLVFSRMIVREGRMLLGSRENPLIVARGVGLGKVVALAFDTGDLQFQRWPGAAAFWNELLHERSSFLPHADRLLERDQNVAVILSNMAGTKVLSRGMLLAYLVIVTGGIIGVLCGFRFTAAPERGWAVGALIAVLTGVAAIAAASRWKAAAQPSFNEVYVATARAGSENAVAQGCLGVYSPTENNFRWTMQNETASVRPGRATAVAAERVAFGFEQELTIDRLNVRSDDLRTLSVRGNVSHAHVPRASVELGVDGADVTVSNLGGEPLADCFIKLNRLVLPIGDIGAGATVRKRGIRAASLPEETAYSSQVIGSAQDTLRSMLRAILFPDPVFTQDTRPLSEDWLVRQHLNVRHTGAALYGWSDRPRLPIMPIASDNERRAVGLWAVEMPVTFAGSRLLIPKGVMSLRLLNKSALTMERCEGRFSGTRTGAVLAEFTLPEGCPALAVENATVYVNFRGTAFQADVLVAPNDEKVFDETKLGRWARLTGGQEYAVADAAKFFNPTTRSIVVAVNVENALSATGKTIASTSLKNWQIRDLDIELTGAVK